MVPRKREDIDRVREKERDQRESERERVRGGKREGVRGLLVVGIYFRGREIMPTTVKNLCSLPATRVRERERERERKRRERK